MSTLAASSNPSAYWYLARSTGAVALILLTGAVVLGAVDTQRLHTARWPRFVVDALHRSTSLLAIAFLAAHVLTSTLDSYAGISLTAALVPFSSSYRPFWIGLGAFALDLLLALTITSLLRRRIGYGAWRGVHWLAYACWPIALLHGLGAGSDIKSVWLLALSLACTAAVCAAVLVRALAARREHPQRAFAALAGACAFMLFLALWLPAGPLGNEWARRSGTPTALLDHVTTQGAGR